MPQNTFSMALACAFIGLSVSIAQAEKVPLQGKYLQLEGGFKVPTLQAELGTPNMLYSTLQMDKRPGSYSWIMTGQQAGGTVLELTEQDPMGTGDVSTWPTLALGRHQIMFEDVLKLQPRGAIWLDADNVLASGRKTYRSGTTENWIGTLNMNTGARTYYTIKSTEGTDDADFHVMQAFGAGFMRITDPVYQASIAGGNEYLIGVGGYDVLHSPLGPSLAQWNIGDLYATPILDHWHTTMPPERRDPYYIYPSLDPNTYDQVQLPMWLNPDAQDGFWQGTDVGGLAFINHPEVKGVVATTTLTYGVHDYRAQGDCGSGKWFLVADPAVFYTIPTDGTCLTDRLDHQDETGNSVYPAGMYERWIYVYDPDDLAAVKAGTMQPWDPQAQRYIIPTDQIPIQNDARKPTEARGIYWDNDRQLLWISFNFPSPIMAAYSIVHDDTRPEKQLELTPELNELFGVIDEGPYLACMATADQEYQDALTAALDAHTAAVAVCNELPHN